MVPELEKPRVTEIMVRMDCSGCVQKIKKALHGINGIYDLYIDFPQQKLTVVGWADPERIVKAIKKTRKVATICSHTQATEPPAEPTEPAPEAAPDAVNPPPEAPPAEASPPTEQPKDPPPPENPPAETTPPPAEPTPPPAEPDSQPPQPTGPKDVEELHYIHHHPQQDYNYGYSGSDLSHHHDSGYWHSYPNHHGFRPEPPVHMSYNTYRPSPYISRYEYGRPPPTQTHFGRTGRYSDEYNRGNGDGNNITSMFSDENPNACRIV